MKHSDDLFQLIKALTKTEKRYFKRICLLYSTDKKNNYLKLFDEMDKQKIYDEKKIKKKFKNEKFIKQLNVIKNYLHKLIIKSIRQFYSSNDLDIMMKNMVIHINILYKKRLYNECIKVVGSAKKFASNYEYLLDLSELLCIEKKLILDLRPKDFEKRITDIYKKEEIVIRDIVLSRKYLILRNKLFTIIRNSGLGHIDECSKGQLEDINSDPLLNTLPDTDSTEIKFSYYKCHYMYNLLLRNDDAALEYSEKILLIIEQDRFFKEKHERDYFNSLHNIIVVYIRKGKIYEAHLKVTQLKKILANHKNIHFDVNLCNIYVSTFSFELLIYSFTGETYKTKKLIEDMNKIFPVLKLNPYEYDFETLYFYIAIYYFISEDYHNALSYLNKYEKNLLLTGKDQLEYLTKILYTIMKYEMGEYGHLEYYIVNTLKWLKTNNELTKDEQTFFKIFNKIIKTEYPDEVNELLTDIRTNYVDKHQPPGIDNGIYALDIGGWIEAKLNNRKFIDVIREKASLITNNYTICKDSLS